MARDRKDYNRQWQEKQKERGYKKAVMFLTPQSVQILEDWRERTTLQLSVLVNMAISFGQQHDMIAPLVKAGLALPQLQHPQDQDQNQASDNQDLRSEVDELKHLLHNLLESNTAPQPPMGAPMPTPVPDAGLPPARKLTKTEKEALIAFVAARRAELPEITPAQLIRAAQAAGVRIHDTSTGVIAFLKNNHQAIEEAKSRLGKPSHRELLSKIAPHR